MNKNKWTRDHLKNLGGTIESIIGTAYYPLAKELRKNERMVLLHAGEDFSNHGGEEVRLMGYYNLAPGGSKGKMAIILHGWEGNAKTPDVVSIASRLLDRGYDCFRLNLRDHGGTGRLNPGFFNCTLLQEVRSAILSLKDKFQPKELFIVGTSLGGNFAVRLATLKEPLEGLKAAVAICPPVYPDRVVARIDSNPVFRRYFLKKWLRSLEEKQKFYPNIYDFTPARKIKTVAGLTDWVRTEYTNYASNADYFNGYSIKPSAMRRLACSLRIVAAENDPVIPASDYEGLRHGCFNLKMLKNGGHLGFASYFPVYKRLLTDIVVESLET